jgi:hypothetical protein
MWLNSKAIPELIGVFPTGLREPRNPLRILSMKELPKKLLLNYPTLQQDIYCNGLCDSFIILKNSKIIFWLVEFHVCYAGIFALFNRKLFVTTNTLENAIAPAANMGLR